MGAWPAIFALALASFAVAAFVLRLPKQGFSIFGLAIVLGLAGYAWQGSPDLPDNPKQPDLSAEEQSGEAMVSARRGLFSDTRQKPDYLVISDAFARRGKFGDAAGLLRQGLRDNPNHLEGWLALGLALTGHADGYVTPAAVYAYDKAREINPANPGAYVFLAISYLQTGQIRAARDTYASLLERTPEDAPWRKDIEARVAGLDEMIANAPMLQ